MDLEIIMEMCGYERREGSRYGTVSFHDEDGAVKAKTCRVCSELKEYNAYWKGSHTDGLQTRCKECMKRERKTVLRDYVLSYAREYQREKYEENPERFKEKQRRWQQSNPDKVRLASHRRQARKRLLPDTLTEEQASIMIAKFGGCVFTGSDDVQLDHVIPLATGHGGTTKENMVPLRSNLNQSKSDRNIFEWFNDNKERFNLEQAKFDALIEYLAKLNDMTIDEYRDYVYWCHANPRDVAN